MELIQGRVYRIPIDKVYYSMLYIGTIRNIITDSNGHIFPITDSHTLYVTDKLYIFYIIYNVQGDIQANYSNILDKNHQLDRFSSIIMGDGGDMFLTPETFNEGRIPNNNIKDLGISFNEVDYNLLVEGIKEASYSILRTIFFPGSGISAIHYDNFKELKLMSMCHDLLNNSLRDAVIGRLRGGYKFLEDGVREQLIRLLENGR